MQDMSMEASSTPILEATASFDGLSRTLRRRPMSAIPRHMSEIRGAGKRELRRGISEDNTSKIKGLGSGISTDIASRIKGLGSGNAADNASQIKGLGIGNTKDNASQPMGLDSGTTLNGASTNATASDLLFSASSVGSLIASPRLKPDHAPPSGKPTTPQSQEAVARIHAARQTRRLFLQSARAFPCATPKERQHYLLALLLTCDQGDMRYLQATLRNLHRDFLGALPPVLQQRVLGWLGPRAWCVCARVSKRWRQAVAAPEFWAGLYERIGLGAVLPRYLRMTEDCLAGSGSMSTLSGTSLGRAVYQVRENAKVWQRQANVSHGRAHRRRMALPSAMETVGVGGEAAGIGRPGVGALRWVPWPADEADTAQVEGGVVVGCTDGTLHVFRLDTPDPDALAPWSADTPEDESLDGLGGAGDMLDEDAEEAAAVAREVRRRARLGCHLVHTMHGHDDRIHDLCVATPVAGETQVVSASGDATIKVWSVRTGRLAETLQGHRKAVLCLGYRHHTLGSGAADGTIRLWEWTTSSTKTPLSHLDRARTAGSWQHARTLYGHKGAVKGMGFDATILLSIGNDNTMRLWHVQSGNALRTIVEGAFHHGLGSVWFDAAVGKVAVGLLNGTVQMWSYKAYQPVSHATGGTGRSKSGEGATSKRPAQADANGKDVAETHAFYQGLVAWAKNKGTLSLLSSHEKRHVGWVLGCAMDVWRLVSVGVDGRLCVVNHTLDKPLYAATSTQEEVVPMRAGMAKGCLHQVSSGIELDRLHPGGNMTNHASMASVLTTTTSSTATSLSQLNPRFQAAAPTGQSPAPALTAVDVQDRYTLVASTDGHITIWDYDYEPRTAHEEETLFHSPQDGEQEYDHWANLSVSRSFAIL